MRSAKVTLDFSDCPELVRLLRLHAARTGRSQKELVACALDLYFSHEAKNEFMAQVARSTFAEWNNPEDDVYSDL